MLFNNLENMNDLSFKYQNMYTSGSWSMEEAPVAVHQPQSLIKSQQA